MKSSIEKTKLSPVDVELSVTGFKDVFTDESRQNGGTDYTMKLKRKHPRAKIIGDDIYVRRPGATGQLAPVCWHGWHNDGHD